MKGTFIVLDGPDGTGTTTHAKLLAERLKKEGHDVLVTAEPTDGPIGTWIRELLKGKTPISPLSLQLLFSADRAWHVQNVIEPALKAGKTIICDRYSHSTIIYAEAQGIPTDMLKKLNNDFIQPSVTVFTLPPLDTAIERITKREEQDLFDQKETQKRIHAGYRVMAEADASIHIVDTSASKEDAAQSVYEALHPVTKR